MSNNNYQSVSSLQSEPAFMFEQSRLFREKNISPVEAIGASTSEAITHPERHVQSGNFFGNVSYDDFSFSESIRNKIK